MKTQKGITLIALIITIIVMLILVGVSVSVALNTGLFKTAQGAAKNTEAARVNETKLSNGTIDVQGVGETNINDYVQGLKDKSEGYTHKLVLPGFECKIKADTTFADLIEEYDEFTEMEPFEDAGKFVYFKELVIGFGVTVSTCPEDGTLWPATKLLKLAQATDRVIDYEVSPEERNYNFTVEGSTSVGRERDLFYLGDWSVLESTVGQFIEEGPYPITSPYGVFEL